MRQASEANSELLTDLLAAGDANRLRTLLAGLPPGACARLVTRLDESEQQNLLLLLAAEDAALLLKVLSVSQAAQMLETLPAERTAAIVAQFPSNDQVDLLAELGASAEAVLNALPPTMAQRVRRLRQYPENTAGGLMVAEYLAYADGASVADVIDDLRTHTREYSRLQAQYAYVIDASQRLVGVLRLRDLLLLEREDSLAPAITRNPLCVPADMPLDALLRLFDRHPYFGIPVVNAGEQLLGVVLRADVEEALAERSDRRMLLASGVLGGEEFRSMSWHSRVLRRAPWLAVSLLLSLLAASVIGLYQETLSAAIALAVFLPVISGMGGNSGNQALAVSIRELSLGLIQTHEYLWVVGKEAIVGLTNGLFLGLGVATLCLVWQRNLRLSGVVGVAIALNMLVSACLGGIVPLALKRWGLDPALASGPVLAAVNDLCGFLFALVLADIFLPGV